MTPSIAACSPFCQRSLAGFRIERCDHAHHTRRRGRFQRLLSPPGRPRAGELRDRWPTGVRPAQQGLLDFDSRQRHPVDGSDLRFARGGVRRQDQSRDQRHHAVRTRPEALRHVSSPTTAPSARSGRRPRLAWAAARWGNFLVVNAERTGRFLDTPEFWPMHDTGNTGTLFDRMDFQPSGKDALHLNLMAARNWMQVPNTYDQARQDQKQKVVSFNIAPGYQHTIDARTLVTVNAFFRRDRVNYYPSRDPLRRFPGDPRARSFADEPRRPCGSRARAGAAQLEGRSECRPTRCWTKSSVSASPIRRYNAPGSPADTLGSLLPYDLSRGGRLYEFRGTGNHRSARALRAGLHHPGRPDAEHRSALRPLRRTHGRTGRPAARRVLLSVQGDRHGDPRRLQPHHGNSHQ